MQTDAGLVGLAESRFNCLFRLLSPVRGFETFCFLTRNAGKNREERICNKIIFVYIVCWWWLHLYMSHLQSICLCVCLSDTRVCLCKWRTRMWAILESVPLTFFAWPHPRCHFSAFLSAWEDSRVHFPRLRGDRDILRGRLPHCLHGGHCGGVPHEEHCKEARLWWPASGSQTDQADPPAPPGNRK